MAELYLIPNGPMPTTAAQAVVTTGTAIKTMLQVKLGDSVVGRGKIIEWGISFDGSAAAAAIKCELLTTGTVKATITEHVATGIINLDPLGTAVTDNNPFAFGAAGDETGFTGTAEGTITAVDMHDFQFLGDGILYTLNDLRSKKGWGYSVGMSLTLCDMIGVTVEGRWASEKAVSVNSQFRF